MLIEKQSIYLFLLLILAISVSPLYAGGFKSDKLSLDLNLTSRHSRSGYKDGTVRDVSSETIVVKKYYQNPPVVKPLKPNKELIDSSDNLHGIQPRMSIDEKQEENSYIEVSHVQVESKRTVYKDYNEKNYGVGLSYELSDNLDFKTGYYKNSYGKDSYYGGAFINKDFLFQPANFDPIKISYGAMVVGITGYDNILKNSSLKGSPLLPNILPTIEIGNNQQMVSVGASVIGKVRFLTVQMRYFVF